MLEYFQNKYCLQLQIFCYHEKTILGCEYLIDTILVWKDSVTKLLALLNFVTNAKLYGIKLDFEIKIFYKVQFCITHKNFSYEIKFIFRVFLCVCVCVSHIIWMRLRNLIKNIFKPKIFEVCDLDNFVTQCSHNLVVTQL